MALASSVAARFEDRATERSRVGGLGVLVAAAALAVVAGPAGAAAGIAVAVAWLLVPVPYTLALAHVALLAVFPEGVALARLAPVEAGLLLVLLEPVPGTEHPLEYAGATVLAAGGLLAVVALGFRWFDALWPAALALALIFATAAYGLHRYELLRLGLLEAS